MYQFAQASYRRLVLYDETKTPTTEIFFSSFWSNEGTFIYEGQSYTFSPTSILFKKIEILRDGKQIGEIDFDWRLAGTIKIENTQGMTKMFTIKGGSFMQRSYEVHDFLTNHLLTIKRLWNWSRFNFDYYIKSGSGISEEENFVDNKLLVIASLYAAYLISKKRKRRRNA